MGAYIWRYEKIGNLSNCRIHIIQILLALAADFVGSLLHNRCVLFFWKPIINPDKTQCASALDLQKTLVPDVGYLSSVPHVRTSRSGALLR